MGHVTALGGTADEALKRADRAWRALVNKVHTGALAPASE
jgi:hypothetical protein